MNLREIAERAGVSVATVSRFQRDREAVSLESRRKIEQVLEELGHAPGERKTRKKTQKTIAFVVPDVENPFFTSLVKNVELFLSRMGYFLMLCNTWGNVNLEAKYLRLLEKYPIDGVLLIPSGRKDEELACVLQKFSIPLLTLDRRIEGVSLPLITCDNAEGVEMAAQHLLRMGRERIVFIAGRRELSTSIERLEGYKRALAKEGLEFQEKFIIEGDFSFQSGFEAGKRVLAMREKVDAVLAANDFMALGVMDCLKRAGVRIPADIGVVGYDDIWLSRVYEPPLTTVRQPVLEMCELAVNMLLRFVQDGKTIPFERVFKPELIVRSSSLSSV
ncbi:MAG: LacI family DNA-binding transcriptional regulator [Candidatus Caldatribacteriaceae bacterium]